MEKIIASYLSVDSAGNRRISDQFGYNWREGGQQWECLDGPLDRKPKLAPDYMVDLSSAWFVAADSIVFRGVKVALPPIHTSPVWTYRENESGSWLSAWGYVFWRDGDNAYLALLSNDGLPPARWIVQLAPVAAARVEQELIAVLQDRYVEWPTIKAIKRYMQLAPSSPMNEGVTDNN